MSFNLQSVKTEAHDLLTTKPRIQGAIEILRGRSSAMTRGTPLSSRAEAFAPFFIIGSGRSGTTLLRRILTTSPSIHIPPESNVLGSAIRSFSRLNYAPWEILVDMTLRTYATHPQFDHFRIDVFDLRDDLITMNPRRRSLATIVDSIYRLHCSSQHDAPCERWGDKSPFHTVHAFRIARVFPFAKFIHMMRDGVDVAYSFAQANLASLDDAARMWSRRTRMAIRFAREHPESTYELKFEDLVADPVSHINDLLTFLNVTADGIDVGSTDHVSSLGDANVLKHHKRIRHPIDPTRVSNGRQNLPAHIVERLTTIMRTELKASGYLDHSVAIAAQTPVR